MESPKTKAIISVLGLKTENVGIDTFLIKSHCTSWVTVTCQAMWGQAWDPLGQESQTSVFKEQVTGTPFYGPKQRFWDRVPCPGEQRPTQATPGGDPRAGVARRCDPGPGAEKRN